ncbi:RHS repeat-associated core domain-containing protein, partial [Candidatus Dependentiae bacterium]|nr:RHS repeat-associated core domain-containing protein [Candidatus Dependentiae bacterium]
TYNYALPVEAINALDYKSEISYYSNTYLVKTSTDINGNNVSKKYDSLDRIIRTNYPQTAGTYTEYEYHDEIFPAYTVVRNNIEAETFSESVYYYDGMGRFIYGGVKEDVKDGIDSWVVNGVDYDHMGRKNNVYEPQKDFGINFSDFRDPRENLEDPSKDLNYINYEYDVLGRTKKVFIPDAVHGNTIPLEIEYEYNDYQNSVKITDTKGQPIKYYYNSQDKLKIVEELDENGYAYSKTRFKYDLMGNMTEMRTSKDGRNWMVSKYTYDSERRLVKSVLPDSGESTFIYDLNGNLTQRTDAKGITIKYYYDKLNRQTKIEYPDSSYIQYEYDNLAIPNGKGKLYSKRKYQAGEGIVSENLFSDFDDLDRLLEKKEFINFEGHNPVQVNHNYSYNKAGFMLFHDISVNGQEIQKMEYDYDLMGRADVLFETVMGDLTTKTEIARIRNFNPLGMVEDIEYANNIHVQYKYNEYRHWMEEMDISIEEDNGSGDTYKNSIFHNQYLYDVVGNRTKLIDESGIETTYNYDSLYRLTNVNGKYYNKEGQTKGSKYTYDQVGNRLTYNSKYGKITYEYDESSNRLNRVNFNRENDDLSYMLINYDANGNTKQRDYFRSKDEIFEQELYEYNYDNMMTHYVRPKPVMKNNRIEMEVESELNMEYDVNGIRIIKKCYPNTSDSTIYIYEGGEVVLEITYEQIPKNKYLFTYAGGKKVSRTSFNIDGTIDLDSRKYFHQNFLGSIAMITDKDGNIEEHNKYEPFGDILWSKSYIDTDNDYKFTGKKRDKESNLDYFNARYLDTKLGRFMKVDVVTGNVKNPQTLNRWVYVLNNPLRYIDILGLYEEIVVSGGPSIKSIEQNKQHDQYWGNFYSSAKIIIKNLKKSLKEGDEITWLVYRPGFEARGKEDENDKDYYIKKIEKAKKEFGESVNLVWFNSKDEFIKYMNEGKIEEHDEGKDRSKEENKINVFYYFGHGTDALYFEFGTKKKGVSTDCLYPDDLKLIEKDIFAKNTYAKGYGCFGAPVFSEAWEEHFGLKYHGVKGRVTYYRRDKLPKLSPGAEWN